MTGALGVRAVLAVAADRAVDDPRVLSLQSFVADSKAVEHTGAERFEHDVGVLRQLQQQFATLVAFEVDAD